MNQDPFNTLPLTIHIKKNEIDEEYKEFVDYYKNIQNCNNSNGTNTIKNIWIIKPGENTNRGNGIQLAKTMTEIQKIINNEDRSNRTFIVQKDIETPLLINKRKCDIRTYGLMTSIYGSIKGYFYNDGYIRTSSKE